MANNIAVNDLILVKFWSTFGDQAAVNRYWFECTASTGTGGTDVDFATTLGTNMPSPIKNLIATPAVYNGLQVQIYRNGTPFVAVNSTAGTGGGTGGAQGMGRQLSGLIQIKTNFAGQQFRGRSYIPFPAAAEDQNSAIPTGAYIVLLNTYISVLFTTWIAGGGGNTSSMQMVIKHGPDKDGVTPPPTFVTSMVPVLKWATQRRRGSFGRTNLSPV
jgi:hypothetical protein